MKILVSGASGFVGGALLPALAASGHQVVRLARAGAARPGAAQPGAARSEAAVTWAPAAGRIDPAAIEGYDAVVHLAGEPIADKRWTPDQKRRIRDSRVDGTRLLSEALTQLSRPPRVLACASAIGYYGSRGDALLNEDSPSGNDFLAEACREWEAATGPAARAGIRVVNLRFGFILGTRGGGLRKMLPPFRMGLGGPLGDGRQYVSWVTVDDAAGAAAFALTADNLRGPVNVVAPRPVTNAEFTRTLGRVLSRPVFLPMPAFAARLAFGEVADAVILASQRVDPARLRAAGYRFRHPDLEPALRDLLGRA
ncbi:MAG TPA: TIGR01777 family oxidoreductase [Methylomirabilota bacterium]|nr:TIGR01777 family oxidoreductase [Methylomirabilota bacterium]